MNRRAFFAALATVPFLGKLAEAEPELRPIAAVSFCQARSSQHPTGHCKMRAAAGSKRCRFHGGGQNVTWQDIHEYQQQHGMTASAAMREFYAGRLR